MKRWLVTPQHHQCPEQCLLHDDLSVHLTASPQQYISMDLTPHGSGFDYPSPDCVCLRPSGKSWAANGPAVGMHTVSAPYMEIVHGMPSRTHSWCGMHCPPCVTFRLVAVSLRGPGQSPVLPFACVSSGRCFLSAAAASAPAGVVSAFAESSGWCVGAVLVVAWCAACASAAPSRWRIEVVLGVAGVI